MANPEELRRLDAQLPKGRRKYPRSRVTQILYIMLALVIVAALVTAL